MIPYTPEEFGFRPVPRPVHQSPYSPKNMPHGDVVASPIEVVWSEMVWDPADDDQAYGPN